MTTPLKFAIAGAAGRMGRQLISAAIAAGHDVTGGTEKAENANYASDLGVLAGLGTIGLKPVTGVAEAASNARVWIDFTHPDATLVALAALADTPVQAVIIGTTGFTEEQLGRIRTFSDRFAIVQAGNFSLGIALMTRLTQIAATHLRDGWDIEILETHHKHKVDAPSGTALMLGDAAALGRNAKLDALRQSPYDGPDAKREAGKIGFSVRRSGGVIGEHDVSLSSDFERISISHSALDRRVFADGAIKAAEWAARQPPGLYSIHEVLGL